MCSAVRWHRMKLRTHDDSNDFASYLNTPAKSAGFARARFVGSFTSYRGEV